MLLGKRIIYFLIIYSRFVFVLRWIANKLCGNQLIILYTHRIIDKKTRLYPLLKKLGYFTSIEFRRKIKYLKKYYHFISLEKALTYLKNGNIPKNCIVLTFDDGYKCNYKIAYPMLKKFNIPATIFISTDSMNNKKVLWYDRIISAIGYTKKNELSIPDLGNRTYNLASLADKVKSCKNLCELLKQLNDDKREMICQLILRKLEVEEDKLLSLDLMLNWDEVREMKLSELINFGSHTLSHSILTKTSSKKARSEIFDSRKIIEEEICSPIKVFAYPNGDSNIQIENIVKECGYDAAFTVNSEIENNNQNFYHLGRQGFIHESLTSFAMRISGSIVLLKKILLELGKIHPWLLTYFLKSIIKKFYILKAVKPKHIFLTICDHFEPLRGNPSERVSLKRVREWLVNYPKISKRYTDSDRCNPRHTFFYPAEEYRKEYIEMLEVICKGGYGEVEVHLHHDNDNAKNLRKTLNGFKNILIEKHGLLSANKVTGEATYGFVHGNWALDNSSPDGRWCGVNNEITILQETGCYADFTMPSAPHVTQTDTINSLYYSKDDPRRPKSHNRGKSVLANHGRQKGLLMVQGPLMLNWGKRKWKVLPTIENSAISLKSPFRLDRLKLWINANVHVKNRSDCIFIKLHTHGCNEGDLDYLLKGGLDLLFNSFVDLKRRHEEFRVHFTSAREMVNLIYAIEDGVNFDDEEAIPRDYILRKN